MGWPLVVEVEEAEVVVLHLQMQSFGDQEEVVGGRPRGLEVVGEAHLPRKMQK